MAKLHLPLRTVSHLSDQPATSEVDLNSGRPVPPILDAEEHWLRQIQYVPALLVREMLQRPGSIRLTGIVRSGDEWLQSVEGEIGEARLTLFIGPADRIWQVQRLVASPLTGDSIERIELRGDQRISGFVVPERVRRFVDGDLVAELSIGEGPASDVSQFELGEVLPLVEEKVPPVQIERLADGVWRMGGIGGADYQSLAVIQDDELVLLETPRNLEAMRAAIEALRQEIGPLPVRTAVVTHHHFDHSGGVRFAMEEGARILVPRGTEELFGRIAAAPRTLEPDGAVVDPWSLSVRGVERMTLTPDRSGSVIELFSLGENEHAEGMLFAWIPEHGIVFQGDIFVHREEPEAARSQAVAFLLRLRELGLTPGRIVGVHGEIATLDDLERAVAAR